MKKTSLPCAISTLLLATTMSLTSCFSRQVVWDGNELWHQYEMRNVIVPESEWNTKNVWRRVSGHPAVYVPTGYPKGASLSSSQGQWVEDERDGKRFFVPFAGVPGMSASILKNDALKNSRPFKATPAVY